MSKIKICVDAGHGSNTAGKRTPPMPLNIDFNNDGVIDVKKGAAIREHIANVGVAMLLTRELERCGLEVIKTGFNDNNAYDDTDTPLSRRQETVKKAGCDYSVSIHFNAYGEGENFNTAEGTGIYIHNKYSKDSMAMAVKVLNQIFKGTEQKNRSITPSQLAICNCKAMNTKASILVECAFMTNLKEAINMMGNADYWEETAVEIAKGICDCCDVAYVEDTMEDPKPEVVYKVQAGAFGYKVNADFLVEKLKELGFKDAYMYTSFVGGSPLYRVQIGAYKVRANAEKILIRAKAVGFRNAFIQTY